MEDVGEVALAHPVASGEQAQTDEFPMMGVRVAEPALDDLPMQMEESSQRLKRLQGGLVGATFGQQLRLRAMRI